MWLTRDATFRRCFLCRIAVVRSINTFGTATTRHQLGINAAPDPTRDRISEEAVLKVGPDGAGEIFHSLVHPGHPIPLVATRIHGISDADLAGAPLFAAIAPGLTRFLAGADLAGFALARFDLPLLTAELARVNLRWSIPGRSIVDALAVYHRAEPRTLAVAVRRYLGKDHARPPDRRTRSAGFTNGQSVGQDPQRP